MNTGFAGDTVVVGRILGAWGVQGWIQVYSWTDPPESLFTYQPWFLGDSDRAVALSEWRRSGRRLIARLPDIDTPEAAAGLAEFPILVPRSQLPKPDSGKFYWHDLIDLEVVNLEGHEWGRVRRMLATGAHDVMEVERADGRNVLIPFVSGRFVRDVDLATGRISVDWPEEWEQ